MASTNAMCTAIGHAVGERADTLRTAIAPLLKNDKNHKRHPYDNGNNVIYVKNTLNNIGFYKI